MGQIQRDRGSERIETIIHHDRLLMYQWKISRIFLLSSFHFCFCLLLLLPLLEPEQGQQRKLNELWVDLDLSDYSQWRDSWAHCWCSLAARHWIFDLLFNTRCLCYIINQAAILSTTMSNHHRCEHSLTRFNRLSAVLAHSRLAWYLVSIIRIFKFSLTSSSATDMSLISCCPPHSPWYLTTPRPPSLHIYLNNINGSLLICNNSALILFFVISYDVQIIIYPHILNTKRTIIDLQWSPSSSFPTWYFQAKLFTNSYVEIWVFTLRLSHHHSDNQGPTRLSHSTNTISSLDKGHSIRNFDTYISIRCRHISCNSRIIFMIHSLRKQPSRPIACGVLGYWSLYYYLVQFTCHWQWQLRHSFMPYHDSWQYSGCQYKLPYRCIFGTSWYLARGPAIWLRC